MEEQIVGEEQRGLELVLGSYGDDSGEDSPEYVLKVEEEPPFEERDNPLRLQDPVELFSEGPADGLFALDKGFDDGVDEF